MLQTKSKMQFITERNNSTAAEQLNGGEIKTATFLSRCVISFSLSVAVSRHDNAAVVPLRV